MHWLLRVEEKQSFICYFNRSRGILRDRVSCNVQSLDENLSALKKARRHQLLRGWPLTLRVRCWRSMLSPRHLNTCWMTVEGQRRKSTVKCNQFTFPAVTHSTNPFRSPLSLTRLKSTFNSYSPSTINSSIHSTSYTRLLNYTFSTFYFKGNHYFISLFFFRLFL